MSSDTRFMSLGVSCQVGIKPACSAAENGSKIEISLISNLDMIVSKEFITKQLISLRRCVGRSVPLLFANPEDRFSRVEAHMILYATKPVCSGFAIM